MSQLRSTRVRLSIRRKTLNIELPKKFEKHLFAVAVPQGLIAIVAGALLPIQAHWHKFNVRRDL